MLIVALWLVPCGFSKACNEKRKKWILTKNLVYRFSLWQINRFVTVTIYPVWISRKAENVSVSAWHKLWKSATCLHSPLAYCANAKFKKHGIWNICKNVLDAASKHCLHHHHPFTVWQSVVMHIFLLILRFVVRLMRIIFISCWYQGSRQATLELW